MFKDTKEGQTHSYNDGCGEPEHNDTIRQYKICTECGASDSQKEVGYKEYKEIKEKYGLVGYNPMFKDLMETDKRKAISITPSTHKLLKLLAKTNKRSMGLQLEVMLESITEYHKEFLDKIGRAHV